MQLKGICDKMPPLAYKTIADIFKPKSEITTDFSTEKYVSKIGFKISWSVYSYFRSSS